ncbi:hypothetical protein Tco_1272494 [Tanacetum coccineum]
MLLYKPEKGVQLQAEQSDWLADTDEEINEQELEAHYSYMAKIQKVPNADVKAQAAGAIRTVEMGDSNVIPDITRYTGFERYKAFNDRTVDYDKLERKLNDTLGLLAQKEIDIKEGLKVKAYEIFVVKEKHDELVKQSLLTSHHYEGTFQREKTKVITDLKLKEEKDIDKMISMENQLKFLNEIVYKRSQSIQTIHMLAPKCPTFNGRPTFSNPIYLKKAQYKKPCLYVIPHDQSDPANRLVPDREETLTHEEESRSKLNKDLVKPFDYTKSYALSWKPCQGDSLNLPDHRIHKDGDGDALFQLKSDSLPHAHAQTTKTYYKHRDSRIMKAQELKTKTSAQTLIYKIFLQRYQVYQGRLLASFQDDAKYEHVGQDTRSQGGKDDQDGRIKI